MNFIGYDADNDNLFSKLDINIGTRKYFENFDEEIADDPFNPFANPPALGTGENFNLFDSLLKEESIADSANYSSIGSENQNTFQNSKFSPPIHSSTLRH